MTVLEYLTKNLSPKFAEILNVMVSCSEEKNEPLDTRKEWFGKHRRYYLYRNQQQIAKESKTNQTDVTRATRVFLNMNIMRRVQRGVVAIDVDYLNSETKDFKLVFPLEKKE